MVGRARGTVVVTVDGDLDGTGCELLEGMLCDLIDGQGNLAVAVDLAKATVEPHSQDVFIVAARQARRHGGKLIVKDPPADLGEALRSSEAGDLIELVPDRHRVASTNRPASPA